MKWFQAAISTTGRPAVAALLALSLIACASHGEAKPTRSSSQATKQKKVSQSESLDDIELDVDEATPIEKQDVAPVVVSPKVKDAVAKAASLESKKQYADVLKILKPLVAELPRHGVLILYRAYKATGDHQGELQMLELLLAKNPKDYVVKTQEGEAFLKLNRVEDALTAFQEAKAMNKQYQPAYEGHWTTLEKAKDMYEARAALSDMVKVFGPTPRSQSQLCRLFSTEDFLEKAEEHCRKAIELDPKNPDNYVHLGMSLRDQEKPDAALALLMDASKRFPASEWVLSTAGDLKASKKDFGDAYELYKKAAAADQKSVRSWLGLAKSAHQLQKYPEAISAFQKACALDRKTSIHFRSAASDLKRAGNVKMSTQYLDAELQCE